MTPLKNRVAIVTGASSGIGSAIASKLHELGATVCIHYSQNEAGARSTSLKCGNAAIFRQDFESSNLDLVQRVLQTFGSVSILINCAGVMANSSFFDGDTADYDRVFCINTKVPFILSKDCFEIMKQNKWGRIINISSFVVPYGMGRNTSIHYAASKAALETLTIGLARVGAEFNILVNTIRPGIVETDMQLKRADLEKRLKMVPLKRMAQPEEIASMAAFLVMQTGDFITGQTISVSGGE